MRTRHQDHALPRPCEFVRVGDDSAVGLPISILPMRVCTVLHPHRWVLDNGFGSYLTAGERDDGRTETIGSGRPELSAP